MTSPTGALDTRYSGEETTAVPWDAAEAVLANAQLCMLTTVRRDGRPHMCPLVAVWHRGALYFSTGQEEQKHLNLDANPQVAFAVANDEWRSGLDVVVEGRAERVTDDAALRVLADVWLTKWDGQWEYDVAEGGFAARHGVAHVFGVRPDKVLAFGKEPFTQTTFRF